MAARSKRRDSDKKGKDAKQDGKEKRKADRKSKKKKSSSSSSHKSSSEDDEAETAVAKAIAATFGLTLDTCLPCSSYCHML